MIAQTLTLLHAFTRAGINLELLPNTEPSSLKKVDELGARMDMMLKSHLGQLNVTAQIPCYVSPKAFTVVVCCVVALEVDYQSKSATKASRSDVLRAALNTYLYEFIQQVDIEMEGMYNKLSSAEVTSSTFAVLSDSYAHVISPRWASTLEKLVTSDIQKPDITTLVQLWFYEFRNKNIKSIFGMMSEITEINVSHLQVVWNMMFFTIHSGLFAKLLTQYLKYSTGVSSEDWGYTLMFTRAYSKLETYSDRQEIKGNFYSTLPVYLTATSSDYTTVRSRVRASFSPVMKTNPNEAKKIAEAIEEIETKLEQLASSAVKSGEKAKAKQKKSASAIPASELESGVTQEGDTNITIENRFTPDFDRTPPNRKSKAPARTNKSTTRRVKAPSLTKRRVPAPHLNFGNFHPKPGVGLFFDVVEATAEPLYNWMKDSYFPDPAPKTIAESFPLTRM